MNFCEFSNQKIIKNNIELSNYFITDYLVNANELQIKFYLYGLYLCQNPNIPENTISSFCEKFGIEDKNDVLAIFTYWEELGLVKILSIGNDYTLKYIPISKYDKIEKDVKKGKYSKFCANVQEFITGRQILPNEYYEYIDFLDRTHMEQNALLAIVNYAVTLSGDSIGYKYILTIASSWAYKGILTEKAVLEHIEQSNTYDNELMLVAKELGKTKKIDFEEKEMWQLFTKQWNFDFNFIINTAKLLKRQKKANFNALKDKLESYYTLNIHTVQEADDYELSLAEYKLCAKGVTQELGLYYENLSPIVDHYVRKWYENGYDKKTLSTIATYCFKNGIRTLDGYDGIISKFLKLGLITIESINAYINEILELDDKIKQILDKLSINRKVNSYDREFYKNWIYKYKFDDSIIDYAIEKSQGKFQPMQYLNRILATYHDKNVTTIDDAKKLDTEFGSQAGIKQQKESSYKDSSVIKTHNYTKEELDSLFTNLDDIKF